MTVPPLTICPAVIAELLAVSVTVVELVVAVVDVPVVEIVNDVPESHAVVGADKVALVPVRAVIEPLTPDPETASPTATPVVWERVTASVADVGDVPVVVAAVLVPPKLTVAPVSKCVPVMETFCTDVPVDGMPNPALGEMAVMVGADEATTV